MFTIISLVNISSPQIVTIFFPIMRNFKFYSYQLSAIQ